MEEQQELIEEPVVEAQVEESHESPADKNWRQAQNVMADQKREIDELKTMIYQMTQNVQSQNSPQEEPDEFESDDDGDYVTVATAKKIFQKAKRVAEKEALNAAQQVINQHIHNQNISQTEERARTKYEDYDYVIENYTVPLIKNDPALAHKVNASKNPAETAYKLGKLSDNYSERNETQVSPRAEKVLRNTQRPGSAHTAQGLKTQVNAVNVMSPAEIWRAAQEYANSA